MRGNRRLFGTDGVRGTVGQYPMVPDALVRLGYAIGMALGGRGHEVVVGKDTRLSGYMVESAIEAGLAAAGIDIALTGPLPTSAVARLVDEEKAAAGIVISASHNPFQDNGVKIFDANGAKLSDEIEKQIELLTSQDGPSPQWSSEPGKARRIDDAPRRYIDFCLGSFPSIDLSAMSIVLDAANGAAYATAPKALREAGAKVHETGCEPDGRNINVGCGALEPGHAAALVTQQAFDVGVILDGDADRLIMVDSTGRVIDGDAYLHVLCRCLKALGDSPKGVVGTLMSNCALERSVAGMGIEFVRAQVGDRYVAQELRKRDWKQGSEPSGHILLLDLHATGDGLLAAMALLDLLAKVGMSLDEAASDYKPMPSVLHNISCAEPQTVMAGLGTVVDQQERRAGVGRIVVRPSGTEPVMRVLVEADEELLANEVIESICAQLPANLS